MSSSEQSVMGIVLPFGKEWSCANSACSTETFWLFCCSTRRVFVGKALKVLLFTGQRISDSLQSFRWNNPRRAAQQNLGKSLGESCVSRHWGKVCLFLGLSEYYISATAAGNCIQRTCFIGRVAIGWSKIILIGWFACKYQYAEAIRWSTEGLEPVLK